MRPYDFDEDYSTIVLGTTRSPGVVTLSGHNRDKSWDIQAAKGSTGATSTLNGDPIGQFTATFYLVDDDQPDATVAGDDDVIVTQGDSQFDRWEEFQQLIESTTPEGAPPKALPIYHPDLARNRYTEVVNGGVGGLVHDGRGGATVTVKFLEYRPPKPKPAAKAVGAPASSARVGVTTVERPDPNAAAKAQLAALLAEARKP